jgi:hypothetical protein
MKEFFKPIIRYLTKDDRLWSFFDRSVNRLAEYATIHRQIVLDQRIHTLSDVHGVLDGPFLGMRYGNQAFGSRLWPKLLGTYETELHPLIREILRNPPSRIIDVGCAEGYYAVGFALTCPSSEVHAYDTADFARELTSKLANSNGVSSRMTLHGEFSVEKDVPAEQDITCFIFCDTDGAEIEIFKESSVGLLRHCSLLIETHDYLRQGITDDLLARFAPTHDGTVIHSHCDYDVKSLDYRTPAFSESNRTLRARYFEEGRPAPQKWIYLKPRVI